MEPAASTTGASSGAGSAGSIAVRHGRYARIACVNSTPWNPYLSLLYGALGDVGFEHEWASRPSVGWLLRRRRSVGYLHVHWPEPLYRLDRGPRGLRRAGSWVKLVRLAVRLLVARLLRYRLVWTVHQVYPHESTTPRQDHAAALLLARSCDVLLAHDRATAATAERRLHPRSRIDVVRHGSYVGVYPPGRPRDSVRAELGIASDAFVFLAFGELRAYKGVDLLLDAWSLLCDSSVVLVVAGNAKDPALRRSVEAVAAADPRVRPLLGFVEEAQVAELYAAADAAVLARADGGTSGSLILALSLGLPVVYPRSAAYGEVVGDRQVGWVFEPGDAVSLREALKCARSDPETALARAKEARGRADELAWPTIATQIAGILAMSLLPSGLA